MGKATWVNVSGTWEKCKAVWINVDGTWKKIIDKVNISGVWKDCISYLFSIILTQPSYNNSINLDSINNSYFNNSNDGYVRKYDDSGTLILSTDISARNERISILNDKIYKTEGSTTIGKYDTNLNIIIKNTSLSNITYTKFLLNNKSNYILLNIEGYNYDLYIFDENLNIVNHRLNWGPTQAVYAEDKIYVSFFNSAAKTLSISTSSFTDSALYQYCVTSTMSINPKAFLTAKNNYIYFLIEYATNNYKLLKIDATTYSSTIYNESKVINKITISNTCYKMLMYNNYVYVLTDNSIQKYDLSLNLISQVNLSSSYVGYYKNMEINNNCIFITNNVNCFDKLDIF